MVMRTELYKRPKRAEVDSKYAVWLVRRNRAFLSMTVHALSTYGASPSRAKMPRHFAHQIVPWQSHLT